jgi:signal transduction histidine kinase
VNAPRFLQPTRQALVLAFVYGLFALLWILFSGKLAAHIANSVEELARIETFKGFGFVGVTTLLLFVLSYVLFLQISRSAMRLFQSQTHLVQAERDGISALLASSIAHDSANLLTVLRLNTERLKGLAGMPDAAFDSLERLDRGVTRMNELALRMRNAGRQVVKDKPRAVQINETIREALNLLSSHPTVSKMEIQVSVPADLGAQGFPILVHQVVMNLILNAAEAIDGQKKPFEAGRILIRAWRQDETTLIEVQDNGPGVPEDLQEKIFDTFFTTKPSGTGLGLMSVRSCVEIHAGKMKVGRSALGGALFQLELPDLNSTTWGST